MAAIPLIQPSASALKFGASAPSRTVFSIPTVDIKDASMESDLLEDGSMDDYATTMHLDPAPIDKGTSTKSWSQMNKTLASTFRPSTNEIAVYVAGKKAAEEFPIRQKVSSKEGTIFLCQASIPESRIPFITQMFGVFINTTPLDPREAPEIYKRNYSQYYEGIRRYLLQLYEQSKNTMEADGTLNNTSELELMEGIGAIWRLAECMFFTSDDDKPIALMYCEWLSEHEPGLDLEIGQILLASSGKLSHPQFWPYITQCLLRGMKQSAIFMVEQTLSDEVDEDTANSLESFLRLLKGIPSSESTKPGGKTYERHMKWREGCEKFNKSKQASHLGAEGAKAIRILMGDIDTILEITESWEEAFAAIVLYTNPDCPRHELIPILRICMEKYLQADEISILNRIKVSILEFDPIKTLRYCGYHHPWLAAHLADALRQYDYLDMTDLHLHDIAVSFDSDIRDFFITNYAQSLMSSANLWEVIAGYLLRCGHFGKAILSEWICHVPLVSSRKARKVLKFCKDNDLLDSLQTINRVMGVEEEKRGQYALAIQHFIASKDDDRVIKVADSLMSNYLKNGTLDLEDMLASVSIQTSNPRVRFLRSYAKFQEDYKKGNFRAAGSTLKQLMSKGSAPVEYWAFILFDALPLLEYKQEVIFSQEDIYEFMWCLEEITGSQHKEDYLKLLPTSVASDSSSTEDREQQLNVIRLSLMKGKGLDLENGNSDDLYSELSQTLGVQLPQQNNSQSDRLQEPQHVNRNGGGLTIVTQSSNGNGGHYGGVGHGQHNYADQGRSYQSTKKYPGSIRSDRSSIQEDHDSPTLRNRRPDQLQQRDLDRSKAERMEKRKKHRKIPKDDGDEHSTCPTFWIAFSRVVTCCFPPPLLVLMGMGPKDVQQAWREKVALVFIIFMLCFTVGFLTFGFNIVLCGKEPDRIRHGHVDEQSAVLLGRAYLLKDFNHPKAPGIPTVTSNLLAKPMPDVGGKDMTFMFQNINRACKGILSGKQHDQFGNVWNYFPCSVVSAGSGLKPIGGMGTQGCHVGPQSIKARQVIKKLRFMGEVYFSWEDLTESGTNYVVYNGNVLDLNRLSWLEDNIIIPPSFAPFMNGTFAGKDISLSMSYSKERTAVSKCLAETVKVGVIDQMSLGCVVADVVLYVSLIVILGVVLLRFFLAVIFGWVLSWRLGSFDEKTFAEKLRRQEIIEAWVDGNTSPYVDSPNSETQRRYERIRANVLPSGSQYSMNESGVGTPSGSSVSGAADPFPLGLPPPPRWGSLPLSPKVSNSNSSFVGSLIRPQKNPDSRRPSVTPSRLSRASLNASISKLKGEPLQCPLLHTLMLVTCYSEGMDGLRATCDSLANTSYPSSHKLLLIIADGIIRGDGEDRTTPDICLDMMTDFIVPRDEVEPQSYIAIADGSKRHNMAKIYAGYYSYADDSDIPMEERQRVPMIVIVKCGTPAEAHDNKPGNRGKRDSQIILMSFLQKVMFDDRMTPLEYEFFNAFWNVTKVTPDFYELVLMVDADTKVYPDSLTRMVACMAQDPTVMGLCGETKIANKTESWVAMIQVFEYYISHHLSKAFESIFGGVTCLPGCFCMYRIKAPKGPNRHWVPIIANPDIVEHYSENVVDTLHKKNLLLLGEDRYLTTLMLRTFPKRKMMFVPQAICKTQVPTSFSVLLSQRRRWINSTIHNLMELVLIRDLCGTFCFSMQFVIFMELVGTVVLPAAISFTIYLIIISFIITPVPIIPLLLLAAILGLPAILILMTTRKVVYVGWMGMYLLSLPIWNFVLPVYAFWHFDDFTWGQTRKVQGEGDGKADVHGGKEGEFDSSQIVMKKWCEFEREKRIKLGLTNGITGWYHPMSTYNHDGHSVHSQSQNHGEGVGV
ncbi:Chitin synthase, class 3 [Entomortierella beljakovae]|nr:Chitin synthase, class 3 [Entomortierella beljakovae]